MAQWESLLENRTTLSSGVGNNLKQLHIKMKKLNFILSFLPLFILFGCNPEDDNVNTQKNGILIFGWFADSSCSGDCSSIYKIDNEHVYRDVDYNYPESTFFVGNFELMTNANYQDYEALIIELPDEIFNQPNGCLDSTQCNEDWGGFYLEYKNDDGFHKSWQFNTEPEFIKNYRSLLLDKLAQLNDL